MISPSSCEVSPLLPHYQKLKNFLGRSVGCRHEADDLTQETYLRALRWDQQTRIERGESVLYRIARNLLVDRARRRSRRPENLPLDATPGTTARTFTCPARSADAAERLRLVRAAIAALPPRCREVFILNRFGGLAYADIADRLGLSPSTVEKHMIKALAACHAALAEK
ncbi:MAG: polymerase subunit sigma-24 [Rariglobus sp.]|jgi:RNA polymerase sigma-70 factor (ECF subfamily)|nr:polymerase subunit sigma-24 [Rariglobus sp.]